jgi:hypothetical protein
MMKKIFAVLGLVVIVAAMAGCASQPTEAPAAEAPAAGEVALKVTGLVDNEMSWTEAQVKAMPTMDAERENKEGEMETYTGVSLNTLLDEAGVGEDATTLVFIADDGSEAEIALADVRACGDCIVSFRSQGGFSTVLPGFPNNVQVKGVIEIKVQ